MTDISLNTEEKIELEKRGFYVKENLTFFPFLRSAISIGLLSGLISGGSSLLFLLWDYADSEVSRNIFSPFIEYTPYVGILFWLIGTFYLSYYYIRSSHTFFSESGEILGYGAFTNENDIMEKNDKITTFSENIGILWRFIKYLSKIRLGSRNNLGLILVAIIVTGGILGLYQVGLTLSILTGENPIILFGGDIIYSIILCFVPIFGIILFSQIIKIFLNSQNPLYAFGNLGEKIQKLTPQIEEQSKLIQTEFAKPEMQNSNPREEKIYYKNGMEIMQNWIQCSRKGSNKIPNSNHQTNPLYPPYQGDSNHLATHLSYF